MRAVDTNVLVRAMTGDDPVQSPAAEQFIRANAPVWISHVVLVETVWVLESVFGCRKARLVEALTRVLGSRDLALEDPAVVRMALALYESKGKVGFDDCMVFSLAHKAGHLPLATFDKALSRLEGAQLLGCVR